MRRWIVGATLALGLVGASPVVAPAAAPSAAQEASAMACKRAKIGGQTKCIARGQFCARRHQRDYRRHGFSCSYVDRNGRYHLQ